MQGALSSVDGVESVDVNFDTKTVVVECSEDCDPAEMIAALKAEKFEAKVQ